MGYGSPVKSVTFDNTRKTAALGGTDDIDAIAHIEHFNRNFLPEVVFLRIFYKKFFQMLKALIPTLFKMTLQRFAYPGFFLLAEPQL